MIRHSELIHDHHHQLLWDLSLPLLASVALILAIAYPITRLPWEGQRQFAGLLAAATLIGISDTASKYYVPELGAFVLYAVMVGLLMWRPQGLFGKRQ